MPEQAIGRGAGPLISWEDDRAVGHPPAALTDDEAADLAISLGDTASARRRSA